MNSNNTIQAVFAANNTGVTMLRNGFLIDSLRVFKKAAILLDSSLAGHLRASNENFIVPTHSIVGCSDGLNIRTVEEYDFGCLQELRQSRDSVIHVFPVRYCNQPEASGDLINFHTGAVLYNYALASLLCMYHYQEGEMPGKDKLLKASKALLIHARAFVFQELAHDAIKKKWPLIAMLHLAQCILSALFCLHRFHQDEDLLRDLWAAQQVLDELVNETLESNCFALFRFAAEAA